MAEWLEKEGLTGWRKRSLIWRPPSPGVKCVQVGHAGGAGDRMIPLEEIFTNLKKFLPAQ